MFSYSVSFFFLSTIGNQVFVKAVALPLQASQGRTSCACKMLFVEQSGGQDLRWCTVLICSHTTVLLSPVSLEICHHQIMGIENVVIKRQKSARLPLCFCFLPAEKNADNLTTKMKTLLALARQWSLIIAISVSAAFSCELYHCTVDQR